MRIVPLHVKTAILASLISFGVLVVSLIVVSASIARRIQEAEKELATLQVENLAKQLSTTQDSFDAETLRNLTNILSGSRPNLVTLRLWKFENGKFNETVSSDDSMPVEEFPDEIRNALVGGESTSNIRASQSDVDSYFRVLTPIVDKGKVTGAVEGVEKLDTIATISLRFVASLSWITLITLFFMGAAFYLLFQRVVYRPLEKLLSAMERARTGDLDVRVDETRDEFGRLGSVFNSMIGQISEMTDERTRQNEILTQKVQEATRELVDKNEQLEAANLELFRSSRKMAELERLAAAGQTAAQFAHEVGTPLNLISGHVQLLESSLEPDSKEAGRLRTVNTQIERIEKIVREMLDSTRFGESVHEPLNMNDLLRKTFDAIEPALDEKDIKLDAHLEDSLPLVSADADRLQQVFINLISNALDAMRDEGRLTVRTAFADGKVVVVFEDNGVGIDAEARSKIFQPMFTTKKRGRGTGLGLFVVKQIMQEHRAEIAVESESGHGTAFTLKFPIAK